MVMPERDYGACPELRFCAMHFGQAKEWVYFDRFLVIRYRYS